MCDIIVRVVNNPVLTVITTISDFDLGIRLETLGGETAEQRKR